MAMGTTQHSNSTDWEGSSDFGSISAGDGTNETKMTHEIAKGENTAVFRLRVVAMITLLLASLGTTIAVYNITKRNEHAEFRAQFEGSSTKVISSFEEIIVEKLAAIGTFGSTISAIATAMPNTTWPFVTIENYQELAAKVRGQSKSLFVRYIPIVSEDNKERWEDYSVENAGWTSDAVRYNVDNGLFNIPTSDVLQITNHIFYYDSGVRVRDEKPGPFFPVWQESPHTPGGDITNFNAGHYPPYAPFVRKTAALGEITMGGIQVAPAGDINHHDLTTRYFANLESKAAGQVVPYGGDPMSTIFLPVFESVNTTVEPVAIMFAVFKWGTYFEGLLPENSPGVTTVIENNCDGAFTYNVVGSRAEYVGKGDHHDTSFADIVHADFGESFQARDEALMGVSLNQDICKYHISVYPSQDLYDTYHTSFPLIATLAIAVVFIVTASTFLLYNHLVERRQKLVMNQAVQSTAIISSLFPEGVRDRLIAGGVSGKKRIESFLRDGDNGTVDDQPIADLFPHSTVFFGDIAGFTAWSSTRDPSLVFILLQTIYQAFDEIAQRRKVFKVETIGDCYVAVTGLPNPDENHVLSMARFAVDCLLKFRQLVFQMVERLGPDTGGLQIRVGLHSGPVIAGVLRGERSRFQLFGDTVNTASRMESSGEPNKIQLSSTTANLLSAQGKGHWIQPREDVVSVKGKGVFETWWLQPPTELETQGSSFFNTSNMIEEGLTRNGENHSDNSRLITWIVELLLPHMRKIATLHASSETERDPPSQLIYTPAKGETCLDEVVDVIKLPKFGEFDAKLSTIPRDYKCDVSPIVEEQLRQVVTAIAGMYNSNSFHSFEHACHVTMAVEKFLTRIAHPDIDTSQQHGNASRLFDYTYGITSDPLTLLAIVFSALIHDVDHRGVSNAQLCKEDKQMADLYKCKSVAEQNSLDIAWDLLMSENFEQLRGVLFATRRELLRFRQVVVNVVLATDIFDKALNDLRKKRWELAFFGENQDESDLRATIVIEHIIQASDVSHTMQHWHIYRKWNERLFYEMYEAYKLGRMAADPASFWYKGELSFFDNYIIPLAKKLKDCNVFGVSSDECLNYAVSNRAEWKELGQQITADMIEQIAQKK